MTDLFDSAYNEISIETLPEMNVEKALFHLMNDREVLIIVLRSVADNVPNDIASFVEARKNGDIATLTREAHGVKSSLRSIGVDEIADCAMNLEKAGQQNDTSYIESHADEFVNAANSFLEKLKLALEKEI